CSTFAEDSVTAPNGEGLYRNPLEFLAESGRSTRQATVRVISRIPSERHVHDVFTKRLPSDHAWGAAWTVPSSSGGGAMTTALQGAELDVLSDDDEFILSHLNHPTHGHPTLRGRTAATPPPAATVTGLEHTQGLRAEL